LAARAIENQCYVIAAAQYGKHNEKRESYGHSIVIDPWGEVLADAGGMDSDDDGTISVPSIITCDIDLDKVTAMRERMPVQQHRDSAKFSH
jgi:predicted amidohydrolase